MPGMDKTISNTQQRMAQKPGRGGHNYGEESNGDYERGSERGRGRGFGGRGRGRGRGRGGPGGSQGAGGQSGMTSAGGGQYHSNQPHLTMEEAMPPPDKKFTGRCRLFVGNLPSDTSEDDFKAMFAEFGEFTEVFINPSRAFGFIRMDYRKNAEAAKAALDGVQKKNRTVRVRFATHAAALRVKYLPSHVSNELLAQAFSIFGELERAVVAVDDRGKPTGDGIVEFTRKPSAMAALRKVTEGVFLLGTSMRPIVVEPLEQINEDDGNPEKVMYKTPAINKEREQPPRFVAPGSFEFEAGQKWKELFSIHEEQKASLRTAFEEAMAKLELEQAGAEMEHQTQMFRQDLLRRQEELRRLEEMHQTEMQKRMSMKQQEFQRIRQDQGQRQSYGFESTEYDGEVPQPRRSRFNQSARYNQGMDMEAEEQGNEEEYYEPKRTRHY